MKDKTDRAGKQDGTGRDGEEGGEYEELRGSRGSLVDSPKRLCESRTDVKMSKKCEMCLNVAFTVT